MGVASKAKRVPAGKRTKAPALTPTPAIDQERMAALVAFTARSLRTPRPRSFGASIVHTKSGKLLLCALNNVARESDPSAHAELRAIRLATKRLSLAGYTLYTTCEPCPFKTTLYQLENCTSCGNIGVIIPTATGRRGLRRCASPRAA